MPVELYLDHNIRRAIADGLRSRRVVVLSALEDGAEKLTDPDLLDRATSLGRPVFTCDDDLNIVGKRRASFLLA